MLRKIEPTQSKKFSFSWNIFQIFLAHTIFPGQIRNIWTHFPPNVHTDILRSVICYIILLRSVIRAHTKACPGTLSDVWVGESSTVVVVAAVQEKGSGQRSYVTLWDDATPPEPEFTVKQRTAELGWARGSHGLSSFLLFGNMDSPDNIYRPIFHVRIRDYCTRNAPNHQSLAFSLQVQMNVFDWLCKVTVKTRCNAPLFCAAMADGLLEYLRSWGSRVSNPTRTGAQLADSTKYVNLHKSYFYISMIITIVVIWI